MFGFLRRKRAERKSVDNGEIGPDNPLYGYKDYPPTLRFTSTIGQRGPMGEKLSPRDIQEYLKYREERVERSGNGW